METFLPSLELLPLLKDQVIVRPNEPIGQVWFPRTGTISLFIGDEEGGSVEVATIGREGMTGLPVMLGGDRSIFGAVVRVPGQAWRMPISRFKVLIAADPEVRLLLLRYVLATMTQMGHNVACARLHEVSARCARWFLLAHDDIDGDSFPMTQDDLALMLGVTRPSISVAASALQRAGLIRYIRGQVTIADRAGLEQAACGCYRSVTREFDRLRDV